MQPRPHTPDNDSGLSSQHTTPSKSADENGKRKLTVRPPPSTRRGPHLEAARTVLEAWRLRTKQRQYTPSSLTAASLLPDSILKVLASSRRIETIDDLRDETSWIYAPRHGTEVLHLLRKVDDDQEAAKRAKANAKKAETAARHAQEKTKKADERKEKKRQREEALQSSKTPKTPAFRGISMFKVGPSTPLSLIVSFTLNFSIRMPK